MSNTQPENTNLASEIATIMRAKGMSTVKMMRVFFEAQTNLEAVPKNVADKAVALDGAAAQLYTYLKDTCRQAISAVSELNSQTQFKIDQLSTVKTAAQLAQNYNNLIKPIRDTVTALEAERVKESKELEAFIQPMRTLFSSLSPSNSNAKSELDKLFAELDKKRNNAYKIFANATSQKNASANLNSEVGKQAAVHNITEAPQARPNIPD